MAAELKKNGGGDVWVTVSSSDAGAGAKPSPDSGDKFRVPTETTSKISSHCRKIAYLLCIIILFGIGLEIGEKIKRWNAHQFEQKREQLGRHIGVNGTLLFIILSKTRDGEVNRISANHLISEKEREALSLNDFRQGGGAAGAVPENVQVESLASKRLKESCPVKSPEVREDRRIINYEEGPRTSYFSTSDGGKYQIEGHEKNVQKVAKGAFALYQRVNMCVSQSTSPYTVKIIEVDNAEPPATASKKLSDSCPVKGPEVREDRRIIRYKEDPKTTYFWTSDSGMYQIEGHEKMIQEVAEAAYESGQSVNMCVSQTTSPYTVKMIEVNDN